MRYERSCAKHKIRDIHTIKLVDFVEAKFKYLATFEEFGWITYLTAQYPVHENLLKVFFANATLKNVGEEDEDPCRIMEINTFVMGWHIRITQYDVAMAFDMPNKGLNDKHSDYPPSMLIPNDNSSDLQQHDRLLHLFVSHFF